MGAIYQKKNQTQAENRLLKGIFPMQKMHKEIIF